MAVTPADVHAAADALRAAGKTPTQKAVREYLGGGSYATISPALGQWNEKMRRLAAPAPASEPPPDALKQRLDELGAEIWGMASERANQRMAADRAALAQEKAELEASRDEAAERADELSAELDTALAGLNQARAELAATAKELEQVKGELRQVVERAVAAEARSHELAKRAEDLNAELARVHEQNAMLVRSIAEAAQRPGPPD